jgi:glycosyltransferase involved in cell wall biosynthesis
MANQEGVYIVVAVFVRLKERLGGLERRLLRILSYIEQKYPDFAFRLVCYGCESVEKNFIKYQEELNVAFKDVIFIKNPQEMIKYVFFEDNSRLFVHGVCARDIFIDILAKMKGVKILGLLVSYEIYNLEKFWSTIGLSNKIRIIFLWLALSIVDFIDTIYPKSLGLLKKIFSGKTITLTPRTFTDLSKFEPTLKRRKIVFLAARMDKPKNPMLMVSAVGIVASQLRKENYVVYMCGCGPDLDDMIAFCRKNRIDDILVFPGYVDPSVVLPDAEVFCSLQALENYPSQALVEAIACGCYIIATDVGDTRVIVDDSFGKLISANQQDLAEALLEYVFMDPKSKERIVKNARSFAERNFSIDGVADHYLELMKNYSA